MLERWAGARNEGPCGPHGGFQSSIYDLWKGNSGVFHGVTIIWFGECYPGCYVDSVLEEG